MKKLFCLILSFGILWGIILLSSDSLLQTVFAYCEDNSSATCGSRCCSAPTETTCKAPQYGYVINRTTFVQDSSVCGNTQGGSPDATCNNVPRVCQYGVGKSVCSIGCNPTYNHTCTKRGAAHGCRIWCTTCTNLTQVDAPLCPEATPTPTPTHTPTPTPTPIPNAPSLSLSTNNFCSNNQIDIIWSNSADGKNYIKEIDIDYSTSWSGSDLMNYFPTVTKGGPWTAHALLWFGNDHNCSTNDKCLSKKTGLAPNTTYYIRGWGNNSGKFSYANIKTPSCPTNTPTPPLKPTPTDTPTPTPTPNEPTPTPGTFTLSGIVFSDNNKTTFKTGIYNKADSSNTKFSTKATAIVKVFDVDSQKEVGSKQFTIDENTSYEDYSLSFQPTLYTDRKMEVYVANTAGSDIFTHYKKDYPSDKYTVSLADPKSSTCPQGCLSPDSPETAYKSRPIQGNNIFGVDFGFYENKDIWFQANCSDVVNFNQFQNPVPACAGDASIIAQGGLPLSNCASSFTKTTPPGPGIVYSGARAIMSKDSTNNDEKASKQGWLMNGIKHPATPPTISYQHILDSATKNDVKIIDATKAPIDPKTPGIYKYKGPLTFPLSTAPKGQYSFTKGAYIILVEGDVSIPAPSNPALKAISVENGAVFILAATGNITIQPGVTGIDGIFSTPKDFEALGTGTDKTLHIEGSIIAKDFKNDRLEDTCKPGTSIYQRFDFFLNMPELLKTQTYSWQEVAP